MGNTLELTVSMDNNIQVVSDSFLCSACGACKAICNKDAIDFHYTNIGRLKADVNGSCVGCGLCLKVCPSLNPLGILLDTDSCVGNIQNVYTGISTDEFIYKNSQSGGVCTALTTYLLDQKIVDGVIVCKMNPGNPPFPSAQIVRDKEQLKKCQGSCYTPIEMLSVLRQVKEGERIAFVGIPCQIEGLSLLEQYDRKLNKKEVIKIGLICDRIHCKGYQDTIIRYSKKSAESRIQWRKKDFTFDGKYYSYKDAPIVVSDVNRGKTSVFPNTFRFALKDLFTSPRCRVCNDKLNVCADIVLGDPWGMSDIDWNHGESVVISRTENGQQLLNNALNDGIIRLKTADVNELVEGQSILGRSGKVAAYSKALSALPHKVDSYLLSQHNGHHVSQSDVNSASTEINIFISWELQSKYAIIREAQKRIAYKTGIWHSSLWYFHIKQKAKSTIKRLLSRFAIK